MLCGIPKVGDVIEKRGPFDSWVKVGEVFRVDPDRQLCSIDMNDTIDIVQYTNESKNSNAFYRIKPMVVKEGELNPQIIRKIKILAMSTCYDYPDVATRSTWEQLYAIECTMQEMALTIRNLHVLVDNLKAQSNNNGEQVNDS